MNFESDDNNSYELGVIYLYRWIDAQDEYNKWYEAQIMDISPSDNKNIKVHYKGWKSKFDTWIDLKTEPERARLLHTFTHKPTCLGHLNQYIIGTKCDCLDSTDKWYQAQIVEINDNGELIRIHYQGWDEKYDEWINKDSYRIAPLHTMTTPSSSSSNNKQKQQTQQTSTSPQTTIAHKTTSQRKKSGGTTIKRKPKFKRNNSDNSNSSVRFNKITSTNSYGSGDDININDNNRNVTMLDDNDNDNDYDYKKIEEPSSLCPPQTEEIKDEENDDDDDDDDNNNPDQITEEQRNKNKQIQKKYLSNFKPSLRDEQQFESKLAAKGLIIESMGEDGNCLFRSISHQVYGKEDFHMILRQKCVQYLQSEYAYFGAYVPGGHDKQIFDAYCTRMLRNGIWGDNLEIQAFSEIYGRSIEIYAYDDKPMKTFSNEFKNNNNNNNDNNNNNNNNNNGNNNNHNNDNHNNNHNKAPIRLSYHCNSHYNSIINPQLHSLNILDVSKVGSIEDEKIRLSYLRSSHASETAVVISDIEATDLEYFKQALAESRKLFEANNNNLNATGGNQQLDIAIKKSLAQYEKDEIEKAQQISIQEQENRDLALAIKKSLFANNNMMMIGNDMNDPNGNFNNNHFNDIDNDNNFNVIHNEINMIENAAIKGVVDRGYTLDQATMAWSVFETQKNEIPQEILIQRMIDYIENKEKAFMYGYSENFYNLQ